MTASPPAVGNRRIAPQVYVVIAFGIVAFSFAAIFIRFAQGEGVPSLVIAAGRLVIASLVLAPFALRRHRADLRGLRPAELLLAGASGALLAVHFATWIASLEYTSVLISVVLVTTSPLWVALLEFVFLRARLGAWILGGLLVAILGGVIIGVGGGGDLTAGSNPPLGGVLALAGALAIAVYLVIGRKLRARLALLPYIWLVYSCAAVVLLLAVALTGQPLVGYSPPAYLWILLLGLVPQLIGHSSLNYALRFFSATFVSIITLTEPIGSAIAAFIIFSERPSTIQLIGSLAILAGVALATIGQQRDS